MKRLNTIYWIVTGLFCAFMAASAIPDVMMEPETVTFMVDLGYPRYFIPFIGVAKLLGVVAVLIPAYPKLKEWAYAGLFFDLIGATYSVICHSGLKPDVAVILLPLAFLFTSRYLWYKKLAQTSASTMTA